MTTEAHVTGDVLLWARERAQLSPEEAAKKVPVDPSKLAAWESDAESHPTLRQAQKLAKALHVPFGYLFLSNPPGGELQLPDLRTVGDTPPTNPSPNLVDVINDAVRKQDWFREYREQEGAEPLTFVGSAALSAGPSSLAAEIRSMLRIEAAQRAASSWAALLRSLSENAESVGILVFRGGTVGSNTHRSLDVEEFRGFALSDEVAPAVFINGRDSVAAQIFTLAHELVHLWVGHSGISNTDLGVGADEQPHPIERFCNRVAAQALMPSDEFLLRWEDSRGVLERVDSMARHYRVSSFVVLRHALDLGEIQRNEYRGLYAQLLEATTPPRRSSGGNPLSTLLVRSSKMLTTALIASVAQGEVSRRDAARLLGVKTGTLNGVAERVLGARLDA